MQMLLERISPYLCLCLNFVLTNKQISFGWGRNKQENIMGRASSKKATLEYRR